jgi:protein-S-isoprenylcysteine O-methyltransferase
MQKAITTAALIVVIYALPLAARPGLIFTFKVLVVMAAAIILFMSQPEMSMKEAKEKKSTDRNSIFAILIGAMVGQVVSIIEWAYVVGVPHGIRNTVVAGVGFALMVAGIAFRIWSIQTLGKFFTATVQIKDEHQVITAGPYKVVRHPSYLGSLVAQVGSAIFLEAPVGAIVCTIALLIAYKLRIDAEETALATSLGDAYKSYQQRTRRLIPCVW